MFRGVTELSLDAKGRMAMPARYRERLLEQCNGALVVTIDVQEKCLSLYPLPEWEIIQAKLDALPSLNPQTAMMKRLLMGNATDVEMDGNGRILVPPTLRKHAGLEKQLVMIGQGKKFELWDGAQWEQRSASWLEQTAQGMETLPPELQSLSL